MKKQIMIASLMAAAICTQAQWTTSGSNIYNSNSGNVGIGNTSPGNKLHISTSTAGDGLKLSQTASLGGAVGLHMNNGSSGGHTWSMYSLGYSDGWCGAGGFALQDQTASGSPLRFLITPTGDFGINTASPSNKLEIVTGSGGDGLRITQNTTGAAGIHMNNTTTGGHLWSLYSLGHFDGWGGAGDFAIQDQTGDASNPRFYITRTGNVGIGTTSPGGKLDVATNADANNITIKGINCAVANGSGNTDVLKGAYLASTGSDAASTTYGVEAWAQYGGSNYGGVFYGAGSTSPGGWNVGVLGSGTGGSGNDWGGYFTGKVYTSVSYQTSDLKLKQNVKRMDNAIAKIKQLNPSTYTFKTEEYSTMNLPKGEQMGLIAQELEKVFPELVTNISAMELKNDKGEIILKQPDFKAVNYTNLVPVLIAGIQEQQGMIEKQQGQIDEMKKMLEALTSSNTSTGIQSVNLGAQTSVVLNQNVPNPFAESTVVKYNIPADFSKAQMLFFGTDGKIIKTVDITVKGEGTIYVFASDISAGIYSYSLIVDGKTIDSKKMVRQ